ncbi:MAG: EAL domain-containing protein [Granulosicoccus sp.]
MTNSNYEVDVYDSSNLQFDDAKIMMVDDEPLNMDVLQIHLRAEGYIKFVAVSDSTTAMETMRHELPDVLLLDLVMPEVTGFDILRLIREDEKLRYLPVIVLTSANDAETKLKALTLGATDFLAKPIDASELVLRLRNTISAIAWQKRMSEVDPLSNLPNRAWFRQMLSDRLTRGSEQKPLSALILINIDGFKAINDSLGPQNGDVVLQSFSERLVDTFRDGEIQPWFSKEESSDQKPTVARLDGDQFVVLLPWKQASQIQPLLEQLTKGLSISLDEPFHVSGQAIYITVSMGVSLVGSESDTVDSLINDAETALRHARRRNDTVFAIYSDYMDARARELLSIQNGLRTAIENEEIYVVYQPKIDVKTNTIAGAEALVRWLHPELGLVSPANFIELAENSGMIVSIGEWVMRESCRQAKEWQDRGHENFKIAVNVSIRQLHEPDFLDIVSCALEDSGLPPDSLIIELTENMIMENAEGNILKLQNLKSLGVKISIDDFGTGYSSLSYLQRFPLDQLKIDQSFVREIRSHKEPIPIIKAVISLAHDLGMTVVAEGVETPEQLFHIQSLNCEEYQGYLCSQPVPAPDFLKLIEPDELKSA